VKLNYVLKISKIDDKIVVNFVPIDDACCKNKYVKEVDHHAIDRNL
jgi:hypothetical protein